MTKIDERATVKGFGMYIDNNFYQNHLANEFPNHFYGYHAAQDLESLSSEKVNSVTVPVYFVTSGTISYIGNLTGYGGVVLVQLDGRNDTALYGHVKISGIKYKIGEHVQVDKPTILTYLGNGFSSETSSERKHLHLGIYKGQDLYFHGHEATKQILESKWYNPTDYLKSKNAQTIEKQTPSSTPRPAVVSFPKPNILQRLVNFLRKVF